MNKWYCVLTAVLVALIILVSASAGIPQFAKHFGAPGKVYWFPVYIEGTTDYINAIKFSVLYDSSLLEVTDVDNGALVPNWDSPAFYSGALGICNISMVYDGITPLPIGSSGEIAKIKVRLIGKEVLPVTNISFSNLQLSNLTYIVGTAPIVDGRIAADCVSEELIAMWC